MAVVVGKIVFMCLARIMAALDFDLNNFADLARVEETGFKPVQLPQLPSPHKLAAEVLRKFAGKRLVPHGIASNEDCDIAFGVDDEAVGIQTQVIKLGSILGEELYPIAAAHKGWVIVLLSSSGRVFCIPIASGEVYFGGLLRQAVADILNGVSMMPVLPQRPFPQEHGYEEYIPGCEGVMWVDATEWVCETDPRVFEQRDAMWRKFFPGS